MELSIAQRTALAILPKISSVLSMGGSSAILAECFYFERKRLDRVYNRLLCAMAIFDILESIFNFGSTWIMPEESGARFAAGSDDSCTAQGFFLQLGLTSPVLNAFLSWYYLLVIRYSWSEEDIKEKAEPWIYRVSLLLGFGTSIAGVPLNLYHPSGLWCWIAADGDPATNNYNIYRYVFYFGPLFMCFFIIAFNMGLLTYTVRKLENASKRYMSTAYQKKVRKKAKKSHNKSIISSISADSHQSNWKSTVSFGLRKKSASEDGSVGGLPETRTDILEINKTTSDRFRDLLKKQEEIKMRMQKSTSNDTSKIMELRKMRKSLTSATSKQSAENAKDLRRSLSVDEAMRTKKQPSHALYSFMSSTAGAHFHPNPHFKPAETPILEDEVPSTEEDLAPETITNKSLLTTTFCQQQDSADLTSFPGEDEDERASSPREEQEQDARLDTSFPGEDEDERAALNVNEQEQVARLDTSFHGEDEDERATLNVNKQEQVARLDSSFHGENENERATLNVDAQEQVARADDNSFSGIDENERAPLNVDDEEKVARVKTCSFDEGTDHSKTSNSTVSHGPTDDTSKTENNNVAAQCRNQKSKSECGWDSPPLSSLIIDDLQWRSAPILSKEALRNSTASSARSSLRSNLEWSECSFLPQEKDLESIRKHLQEQNQEQSLNSQETVPRNNGISRAEATRRSIENNEPLSFQMRSNFSVGEPLSFSSAQDANSSGTRHSVSAMRDAFRNSKIDSDDTNAKQSKTKKKAKRKSKSSMVTEQALFYVMSFLLTFMWSIVNRFYVFANKPAPYYFKVGNAFFDPLQGFINYLVYIRPKLISYRKRNPTLTRLQCIKALITHVDVATDDDKATEEGAQKELIRWRRMKKRMKKKGNKEVGETKGRGSVRFSGVELSQHSDYGDIEDHRLMEEEERAAREDSSVYESIADVEHQ